MNLININKVARNANKGIKYEAMATNKKPKAKYLPYLFFNFFNNFYNQLECAIKKT